jgi:DNA-binding XRE family transcriptional regulator
MSHEKERIEKIMKNYSLDKAKFAERVGIMPTTLDHILKGHKNATLDIFKKIAFAFPEINIDWIVLGKGNMNLNDHVSKVIEDLFSKESNVRRIKEMLTNILENPE